MAMDVMFCILVPSMKFLSTILLRAYLSDISNFISIDIREMRYKVGKLKENHEEKMNVTSL